MDLENLAAQPGTGTHWTSYNGRYLFRTGTLSPLHLRKTLLRIVLKIVHGLHEVFAVLLEYAKRLAMATTQWTNDSGLRLLEGIMNLGLYISRRLRENKLATSLTDLIDFLKPVEIPKCPWGMRSVLCHLRLPDESSVCWRTPYKSFVGTSSTIKGHAATTDFFRLFAKICKGVCPFKWRLWCILGFGTISLDVTDARMKVRLGRLDDVDADVLVEPFDDEAARARKAAISTIRSLIQCLDARQNFDSNDDGHTRKGVKRKEPPQSLFVEAYTAEEVLVRLNYRDLFEKYANSRAAVRLELERIFLYQGTGLYRNYQFAEFFDGTMKPFTGLSVQASFKWKHKGKLSIAVAPLIIIYVVVWWLIDRNWATAFTLGTLLAALYPMSHNRKGYF